MAGGLTGLQGLYGPQVPHGMQGRDPDQFGTNPDVRHTQPGDRSSWSAELAQGTRNTPVIDTETVPDSTPLHGFVADETPDSHIAPYPVGIQQDPWLAQAEYAQLHALDLGGPQRVLQVAIPYPVDLSVSRDESPNASELVDGLPGQLRTGVGNDVDQGYGTTPGYGFAFGHLLRRVFHDNVPTDRTGTVHGERPFWGAWPIRQNQLDSGGSPYGQAGDIADGMNLAPTPVGSPTPYVQPPNPTVAPTTDYEGESGFTGGWVLG